PRWTARSPPCSRPSGRWCRRVTQWWRSGRGDLSAVAEDRLVVAGVPAHAAPGPRPGIGGVLDRGPALTQLERGEGVDHDCRLVEELHSERRLHRTGLWTVGVAA